MNISIVKFIFFIRDTFMLLKIKITMMAVCIAALGILVAPGSTNIKESCLTLLGITFLVAGSNALNMFLERDYDKLMVRTRERPLPAKRMNPFFALLFGLFLSIFSFPFLKISNFLTFYLGFFALFSYVCLYTPLKRISSLSFIIGAFPGAMPVLLGYTSILGKLDKEGLFLFGIAFFWQIPHVIAILVFRAKEYQKAGYPILPSILNDSQIIVCMCFSILCLVFCSLIVYFSEFGSFTYGLFAILLGMWFFASCGKGFFIISKQVWAKKVFIVSLFYQTLLFLVLAIDVYFYKLY